MFQTSSSGSGGLFGAAYGAGPAVTGGSPFGASPSPFGQPQPATSSASLFGANIGSAFGFQTPSSPSPFSTLPSTSASPLFSFNFSSAPAGAPFGASPSGASPFGASPFGGSLSASPFGTAPSASPSPFGASQFGAASPFGATPLGATTSPFGIAPGASPGQFGGSPFPGASPGVFGQPTAAAGFGLAQTGYGGAGFGLGGAGSPLLSAGQLVPTTQFAPLSTSAVPFPSSFLPERELQAVLEAYRNDPANLNYRFRHLALSVTHPALRARHVAVSELTWLDAIGRIQRCESEEDREKLWPELLSGFADLAKRLRVQEETLQHDFDRLSLLASLLSELSARFEGETKRRVERARERENELCSRMLPVMKNVEALENMVTRSPLNSSEAKMSDALSGMINQLQPSTSAHSLPNRVEALSSAAKILRSSLSFSPGILSSSGRGLESVGSRMRGGRGDGGGNWGGEGRDGDLPEREAEELHRLLAQQLIWMEGMTKVLEKDSRDLEIMARLRESM